MKKLVLMFVLLCATTLAVGQTASAAPVTTAPIFSVQRLALATGADYAFYSGAQAPAFPVKKEWQVGVFASYKLTSTLSLTGGTRLGVDSKQFDSKIGLRLLVWEGNK